MDRFAYIARELCDLIDLAKDDHDQLTELRYFLSMALEQAESLRRAQADEAGRQGQRLDPDPATLN